MSKKGFFIFPIFIVLYEMSTYLSNDMYLPALPDIKQFFNITQQFALLSLTFWFIGSLSLKFFTGPLSDKYGRKPLLITGTFLFALANLLAAHTENYSIFLLARFLQGTSVCFVIVAGYASIHEFFDHKSAVKTLALMNSLIVLAPAFGPLLGAYIITQFHWSLIFQILTGLTIISLMGFLFCMPETNQNRATKISFKGMLMDYKNILKSKTFICIAFSFCLVFGGLISWVTASPLFIMIALGKSPLFYGLIQVIVFGGFVIGTRIASFYAGTPHSDQVIRSGLVLIILASLISVLANFISHYSLWVYIAGMTLYAFCAGMIFSPMQRKAVSAAGPKMGCNMALFFTIMGLMCVLGSLAVSLFYKNSLLSMGIILAAFAFLSGLVFLINSNKELKA